jgi:hypothetical protein
MILAMAEEGVPAGKAEPFEDGALSDNMCYDRNPLLTFAA